MTQNLLNLVGAHPATVRRCGRVVEDRTTLGGRDLRYLLTLLLHERGPQRVAELVDGVAQAGFVVDGRPSKVVSDALRWEIAHGRVLRLGWGSYGVGVIPRSTWSRIRRRVATLHEVADL